MRPMSRLPATSTDFPDISRSGFTESVHAADEIICLILQRYHGLIAPAESGNSQQTALRLGHEHDRPVTIYGVAAGREVPLSSLSLCWLLAGGERNLSWWCQPGNGKRQD